MPFNKILPMQRFPLRFIKYGLVGVLNTLIGYGSFLLFIYLLEIHYTTAVILSYLLGTINSFLLNRYWTFRSNGAVIRQFSRFVTITVLSVVLNILLLLVLIDLLNIEAAIAQAMSIAIIAVVGYLGHRAWSFK
jgi:putative flippase GtrA